MISGDSLRFPYDFQHNASQKHPKATKSIPKQPKSAKATGSIGEGGGWSPSWLSWEALWPKGFSNHWFSLSWETYLGGVFLNSTKLRNPFWGGVSQLGSLLAKSCGTAVPQLLCWQKVVALQCHSFTKTHQDTPRHTKTHQDTPRHTLMELRRNLCCCASQLNQVEKHNRLLCFSTPIIGVEKHNNKGFFSTHGVEKHNSKGFFSTLRIPRVEKNRLADHSSQLVEPLGFLELRKPFARVSSQLVEPLGLFGVEKTFCNVFFSTPWGCVLVCLGVSWCVCWCVLVCLGVSWSVTGSAIGSDKQIFYMGCCGTCAFRSWERHCPPDLPPNAQTSFSTPRLPSQPSNLLLNSQTSFSTPRLPSQLLELLRVPAFQLHAIIWYNMCYTMCYIFDIPRPKVPPQLRPIIP